MTAPSASSMCSPSGRPVLETAPSTFSSSPPSRGPVLETAPSSTSGHGPGLGAARSGGESSRLHHPVQEEQATPLSPRLRQLVGDNLAFFNFLRASGICSIVSFAFGLEGAQVPPEFLVHWQEGNRICDARAVCSARVSFRAPKRPRSPEPASASAAAAIASTPYPSPSYLRDRPVYVQPVSPGVGMSSTTPAESMQASGLAAVLVSLLAEQVHLTNRAEQVALLTGPAAGEYYAMVKRHLSSFSVSTLRGAISAWRRWSAWSSSCRTVSSLLPADAVSVQLFLEAVRAGTGVARRNAGGVYAVERISAGLAFLATHLRFPIELDFARPAGAVGGQPPSKSHANSPLWLQDLALARSIVDSTCNQVLEFCGLLILVLFSGGIRFAHAQRSKLVSKTAEGLVFRCHRGKNRRSGQAAPPFEWACPHSPLLTSTHLDRFIALLRRAVPEGGDYLVPTLHPHRSGLQEATGFGSSPCRDSNWRAILRAFVELSPSDWPPRHPGPPCARSTRRALATLAEVLGLSHQERLPLGSWVDPIDEGGRKFSRMPSTYIAGETRLWSQFT